MDTTKPQEGRHAPNPNEPVRCTGCGAYCLYGTCAICANQAQREQRENARGWR